MAKYVTNFYGHLNRERQAGTALALILTLSKCEVRYVIEWDFSTKRFSGGVDGTIGLRFPVLGGDNPW